MWLSFCGKPLSRSWVPDAVILSRWFPPDPDVSAARLLTPPLLESLRVVPAVLELVFSRRFGNASSAQVFLTLPFLLPFLDSFHPPPWAGNAIDQHRVLLFSPDLFSSSLGCCGSLRMSCYTDPLIDVCSRLVVVYRQSIFA